MSVLATLSAPAEGHLTVDISATVCRRVERKLSACGRRALSNVRCHYQQGELTLMGEVPSFYLKQLAQEVARGVEPVSQIHNRLHVCEA